MVEWIQGPGGEKEPYLVQRADGRLLLAPALVGSYRDGPGEKAFAICTRTPNQFFARFHDRMIGQCTPELMERWLWPQDHDKAALRECIRSPPDDELVAVPSSSEIQKRKAGGWSPLPTTGRPLRWGDLEKWKPRKTR